MNKDTIDNILDTVSSTLKRYITGKKNLKQAELEIKTLLFEKYINSLEDESNHNDEANYTYDNGLVTSENVHSVIDKIHGSKFQRIWRPLLMYSIIAIIINNFIILPYLSIFTNVSIPKFPEEVWVLLIVCVAGYIPGRTIEKITTLNKLFQLSIPPTKVSKKIR